MKKKLIIAIDGTAGSGKSTLARALAKRLGYLYLDTGAMYRAIAYKAIQRGTKKLIELAQKTDIRFTKSGKVFVDGKDVSRKIRLHEVSELVSKVAAIKGVRREMVKRQREIGKNGGIVIEGRDIGTVVFPGADIKFFLVAGVSERTKRRYKELIEKKIVSNLKEVQENIISRDIRDSSRKISPLRPAKDAIIIDTTNLTMKKKNDLAWKYVIKVTRNQ